MSNYQSELNLRVQLFKEWLDNGGYETIWSNNLLSDLLKLKKDEKGNVIKDSVTPLVNSAMLAHFASHLSPPYIGKDSFSEYNSLIQKSLFFNQKTIDTEEEFNELIDEQKDVDYMLYRGVSEAKWRLYNSIQRYLISNQIVDDESDFKEFLIDLAQNAREINGGVLEKFLKANGDQLDNDIAVFSFLQHHNCPTPLLDWTLSFDNALFFAIQNDHEVSKGKEIENYFSIYSIENRFLEEANLKKVIESGLERAEPKMMQSIIERGKKDGLTEEDFMKLFSPERRRLTSIMMHGDKLTKYLTKVKHLLNIPINYFNDFDFNSDIQLSLNNNLNIVNQKGVFIWNSSYHKPLEVVGNEMFQESNETDSDYKFCFCYNINKNLRGYINKELEKRNVDKAHIFPDPYDIASNSFQSSLKKFNLKNKQ